MNKRLDILRGKVAYADLGSYNDLEEKSSLQKGIRPVLIIQNNIGNKYSPTVSYIPFTRKNKKKFQLTHVKTSNFGMALCEQVSTIDMDRIGDVIGQLSEKEMLEIERALMIQLGLKATNKTFILGEITRGTIRYADLGEYEDDEKSSLQKGKRPILIVQNDVGNKYSPTISYIPLTRKTKKKFQATHVITEEFGMVLCEQVSTIDRSKLGEEIGRLSNEEMVKVDKALSIQLGLSRKNR